MSCTSARITDGVTPPEETAAVPDHMRTTHFLYLGGHTSQPAYHPLPDTQPDRPKDWSAEAWDKRFVSGNRDYHLFCSQKADKAFMLKVASRKDAKGNWCYEDFDPHLKLGQRSLNGTVTFFKSDIEIQMEKAGIISA